jgi:hypothetical protein
MTLADLLELPPTLDAHKVGECWGISGWSVYEGAKRGDLPVEPITVGRSLRWPTISVLLSIGFDPQMIAGVIGGHGTPGPAATVTPIALA